MRDFTAKVRRTGVTGSASRTEPTSLLGEEVLRISGDHGTGLPTIKPASMQKSISQM